MKKAAVMMIALFMAGCGAIHAPQWEHASILCEPNDGLKHLEMFFGTLTARCNNNATFQFEGRKVFK